MVVDTSYLYKVENESPNQAPSIRDVSEFILKEDMTLIHDSVRDAQAALKAAQYIVEHGDPPSVPRSSSSSVRPLNTALLVHRIPEGCDSDTIHQMIVQMASIVPVTVQSINWVNDAKGSAMWGKTTIFFATKEHADLAFEGLPGPNRPDKSDRPQKRIYFQSGGYMCIRKN